MADLNGPQPKIRIEAKFAEGGAGADAFLEGPAGAFIPLPTRVGEIASSGHGVFEATHGTAPKYAGKDYVNPGSEILSAEMMLRHMGWTEAADLIISSMEKAILSKKVTYDFARLMDGATQVSCSGFGQVMIENM